MAAAATGGRATSQPKKTTKGLTPRQKKILETIQRSVNVNGYPPSMREIGDTVGLASLSSVTHQLSQLEKLGYLRRDPKRPRAMEVLMPLTLDGGATGRTARQAAEPAAAAAPGITASVTELPTALDTAMVPLVGRIAAGGPILADQVVEDVMPLPRQLVGQGELFMLKVAGDSMVDAAICDGDWVVVRRQADAANGDIVAALLDDEATVKTFRQRDGHTWLLPQNTQYEPILGDHATIMGKVVSVLRSL
ncbi:SOS-response transcriptional repressor, LexA [Pseudarthrobacter chlorophenolicus A6]|uniref:LexA repressor n=1 Tax=Pseudarthrobacter chlorophenolicus (strain ATCC 700700 / DSM 12829 / CIP 107037 / JCM 12360 / KCTC 9906 / NCIMB 13794 / A6) TaxID=452863 RepID=LEXA_PSECP|nr:transcriptional repressor LexA [Pseudarthrobacter chlorophenolicus]B8HG97.1 RecName: Full=LexA repressor [Pseudarthrobacter chlorophenolicus A6]ACL39459.1 SOS-response transcriptional repressor, LexA [Pseudarthrobacter chlorophenolicus A6]SDQ98999.1 repressor LexA [Pseudarthrobacter chlorophenolicus]